MCTNDVRIVDSIGGCGFGGHHTDSAVPGNIISWQSDIEKSVKKFRMRAHLPQR